jgi:heavy metal sensor kinase
MGLPRPGWTIRTRLTFWYTGLLLAILAAIGTVSYRILAWSLARDLDASLVAVAEVIQASGRSRTGLLSEPDAEAVLREILGSALFDKFFQLLDPDGQPGPRSGRLRKSPLPLSVEARRNATHGLRTLETVTLASGEPVRLVTIPALRDGRPVELVQVGMSMTRMEDTLRRYLQVLLALVPVGVGLAAVGGAFIARKALAPVDAMARQARRITAEDLAERIPRRAAGDELDYLAETLNDMLGRLEAAFAQMRRFTADAAHELRTPLTALRGGLEVALRAPRSAEEYARVLRDSLEEVDRLTRLAEDLLLLSRTAAGGGLTRVPVELEPLLLDVLEVGIRLARGTGVTARLGEATPATVLGDASALRRLLVNLVENAVKYTPAGGAVELSLTTAGGIAVVAVRDTGIGIEPAAVDRIFQPFVRLDEARSRETGGAGLGLAIARSIAVAHGGTLTVESTPGRGSRFVLRLPTA